MKQIQLANIYRDGRFYGFGAAVDGELLSHQRSATIETNGFGRTSVITVQFVLTPEMIKNPVDIELPSKS
ncbi:hypothetical protein [uncultured Gilliamella sp.]|uniref:hypothetical protein n=1 Tax=uncultured Gilliamella sp. TaxID=1193505 RepID=UPI0025F807BF|nr:hypothetical protein [uncultured Gilliamella sp.]